MNASTVSATTRRRRTMPAMLRRFALLRESPVGMVGAFLVLFWCVVAVLAPVLAPYPPTDIDPLHGLVQIGLNGVFLLEYPSRPQHEHGRNAKHHRDDDEQAELEVVGFGAHGSKLAATLGVEGRRRTHFLAEDVSALSAWRLKNCRTHALSL